jgi:hypothetical protein
VEKGGSSSKRLKEENSLYEDKQKLIERFCEL